MFKNQEDVNQIRSILRGLAGVNEKVFETDNVEIWEIYAYDIKVVWNTKEFNIFYKDNSTVEGISRVRKEFIDDTFINVLDFNIMITEVGDGLKNSSLINAGDNYTEQDIRDADNTRRLLISNVNSLVQSINSTDEELKSDQLFILIKEYGPRVNGIINGKIEGWTNSAYKATEYTKKDSEKSEQRIINGELYPKFSFVITSREE